MITHKKQLSALYTRYYQAFLKSIQLQLCIALISLPCLVSWGLPFSAVSLISTFLFGPFLTLFLLISSCIFFCELMSVSHSFFDFILEYTTSIWLFVLKWGHQSWLIGFAKPPVCIVTLIIPCTMMIMHYKNIKTTQTRVALLTLLLASSCSIMKFFPYQYPLLETIQAQKKELMIVHHDNKLFMTDNGAFSTYASAESFVTYTLLPELIAKTGVLTIDGFIVQTINKRTFDALACLAAKVTIKTIYVPWWTGKIPLFAWKSYVQLKKVVLKNGGKIVSFSAKKQLFKKDNDFLYVCLSPNKKIRYHDATYGRSLLTGLIKDKHIEI